MRIIHSDESAGSMHTPEDSPISGISEVDQGGVAINVHDLIEHEVGISHGVWEELMDELDKILQQSHEEPDFDFISAMDALEEKAQQRDCGDQFIKFLELITE